LSTFLTASGRKSQNQLPKLIEGVKLVWQAQSPAGFKPSSKIAHASKGNPSNADIASVDER
jgi:hypothetical protein